MTATDSRLLARLHLRWAERAMARPYAKIVNSGLYRTALTWEAITHGRS